MWGMSPLVIMKEGLLPPITTPHKTYGGNITQQERDQVHKLQEKIFMQSQDSQQKQYDTKHNLIQPTLHNTTPPINAKQQNMSATPHTTPNTHQRDSHKQAQYNTPHDTNCTSHLPQEMFRCTQHDRNSQNYYRTLNPVPTQKSGIDSQIFAYLGGVRGLGCKLDSQLYSDTLEPTLTPNNLDSPNHSLCQKIPQPTQNGIDSQNYSCIQTPQIHESQPHTSQPNSCANQHYDLDSQPQLCTSNHAIYTANKIHTTHNKKHILLFIGGFCDTYYKVVWHSFWAILQQQSKNQSAPLMLYMSFNCYDLLKEWLPKLLESGYEISVIAHSWGAKNIVRLCLNHHNIALANLITLDCVGHITITHRPPLIRAWENIYISNYFTHFTRANIAALVGGAQQAIQYADKNISIPPPAHHASVPTMLHRATLLHLYDKHS